VTLEADDPTGVGEGPDLVAGGRAEVVPDGAVDEVEDHHGQDLDPPVQAHVGDVVPGPVGHLLGVVSRLDLGVGEIYRLRLLVDRA
jgi:hypothetical protein